MSYSVVDAMMNVSSSTFKINIVIILTLLALNLKALYFVELLFRQRVVVYLNLVELAGR